jgi:hypothetical protein
MKKLLYCLIILNITFNCFAGVDFDTTDDFIDCGDGSGVNTGSGDFSLSAWFRIPDTAAAIESLAGHGGSSTGGKRYRIFCTATLCSSQIDDNVANRTATDTGLTADDGNWHFVVGVRDGNNLRVYYDGVEGDSSPTDITGIGDLDQAHPFLIGAFTNNSTGLKANFASANITEVALYKGVVLSATDILNMFNARIKGLPLQFGATAYWPVDDVPDGTSADGNKFIDRISTNHGTGDNGANNTGLTAKAEEILTYQ